MRSQDSNPLATMAAANPISAADLAAEIGDEGLERALGSAVASGREFPAPPHGRSRQRRPRTALGFGVGLAVVAGLLLIASGWLGGGGGGPSFAAAAIRVAEANPRLLVTAPGWEIVRADEFEPDSGELTFSDGDRHFDVHWYPAGLYGSYLRDRGLVSPPEHGTLLGQEATTITYGREEYATMLSPQGNVFIEVRGRLGSRAAYEEILKSLRPVDVDTWLGAMPPSTVRPEARADAVEEMLRGIPLPPGFDSAALGSESSISDRDSLAVDVGNAVACGWVDTWIAARAAGDAATAERAVAAVEGSSEWPIVEETRVPWFSNYRIVAHQMREGRLDRGYAGYETREDGQTFGFGPAWKLTLGCDGTYRRRTDAP
jgi:hypothetical protein